MSIRHPVRLTAKVRKSRRAGVEKHSIPEPMSLWAEGLLWTDGPCLSDQPLIVNGDGALSTFLGMLLLYFEVIRSPSSLRIHCRRDDASEYSYSRLISLVGIPHALTLSTYSKP